MKTLFVATTAMLSCPAIGIFLLVGWRASWLARYPSLPWMLTSLVLSGWCIFAVRILGSHRIGHPGSRDLQTRIAGIIADKIGAVLVAIGILWSVWLGFSTASTIKMYRTTGTVVAVEHGRAQVEFKLPHGSPAGYGFPAFDCFLKLHAGEAVALLNEGKTAEVAFRTWVFTGLGAANGVLLIIGGLFARMH